MTNRPQLAVLTRILAATPLVLMPTSELYAQEQSQQEVDIDGIEVIQITSEKRVATLQETAIAISAFNAGELARQDIEEPADIQFAIPNALFTDRGAYNIRGVGNNARSSTAEGGTGVHINGIYLTAPSASNEFYDLQSIEVLRGPQGTLYGRNTTAGVVNMITQKPTEGFDAYITLEGGNFESLRTLGAINFSLSDNIHQRFAGNLVKRDGFTENIATGEDIDGRDQFSLRSSTVIEIGDQTQALLFAQYFEEDSDRSLRRGVRCTSDPVLGCSADEAGHEFVNSDFTDGNLRNTVGFVLFDPQLGLAAVPEPIRSLFFPSFNNVAAMLAGNIRSDFYNTNLDGSRRVNPNDPRKVNIDNKPQAKADDLLVSIEISHQTQAGTYTSITAYHERSAEGQRDYDNANGSNAFLRPVSYQLNGDTYLQNTLDFEPVQTFDVYSDQLSQEFRFVSDFDGALNFTAGAYWLNYETDSQIITYFPYLSMLGEALGIPNELHGFDTLTPKAETTSWAIYSELYYQLNDQLKLTAGIRYSDEEKEQSSKTVSPLTFVSGAFSLTPALVEQLTILQTNPQAFNPTAFGQARDNLVAGATQTFEILENDWQETTGKLGLAYDVNSAFTDNTLLFANISRGYKAGGLNPGGAIKQTYDAEYINAIELGTKNTLLDRTLQANATVFYYDYQDIQLGGIDPSPQGGTITDNTDAKVKGIEFEFVSMPINELMINLNISLLDSEVTGDFATPDITQPRGTPPVSVKGNALPYAPEKSLQFGIEYRHNFFDGWEISYLAQTYWQDEFFARVYNSPTDKIDSWQQTDFTISITDSEDIWQVEAFIKNINNNDSITGLSAENTLAGRFRLPAVLDPRQYGIRIHYRFE